jgi:hypothetical protein
MKKLAAITLAFVVMWSSITTYAYAQKRTIHENPHKELKRSCEKCHMATSFNDIRFDHTETRFAIDGHHEELNCLVCHNIENFARVDSKCGSCHQDIHKGEMGTDCSRCHTSQGWRVLDGEEIHAGTNFPLLGRHVVLDCESCHPGMTPTLFRQTPSRCIDCHRTDYDGVTSPDHRSSGFTTDCQTCHQMTAWTPAVMNDHDALFPIFSGVHNRVWDACAQCHINPSNNKIVNCLSCHEHSQPLMDPTHQGMSGYSYTTSACLTCHPDGSAGSFISHDAVFPIYSGTHNRQWDDCAQCHTSPGNNKIVDCLTCHDHAQGQMDPAHQGMTGYSYTTSACLTCHPDGTKGDFLQHDTYFPVYSGAHNRVWDTCSQCHTNASNSKIVDCLLCHEHSRSLMDPGHQGMTGYSYTSAACLSCHPDGQAGDFVAHDAFFPVYSGTHNRVWDTCSQCHINPSNSQVVDCLNCHEHLQSLMDPVHQGMTGYAYSSPSCLTCHPDGVAGPYVDHQSIFPIYSGAHKQDRWNTCATCHQNPANRKLFTCFECHDHNQTKMDDKHRGENGYSYTSAACYDCHPNGRS